MTGPDLKAGNTFADPRRVMPQTLENPKVGSTHDGAIAGAIVLGAVAGGVSKASFWLLASSDGGCRMPRADVMLKG